MQITIAGYLFDIEAPYSAGTIIDAAESSALNALRGRNISNSAYHLVKKMEEIGGKVLNKEALEVLQDKINQLDQDYSFPPPRPTPLELEIELVAQYWADLQSSKEGRLTEEADVGRWREMPQTRVEAERRLEADKMAAKMGLEEL